MTWSGKKVKKHYSCSLGKINYSNGDKPKLIKQNWRVREDLNETIAIFLRDSLKAYLKSDITCHISNAKAYKLDMQVLKGEMTEKERKIICDKAQEEWKNKVLNVIHFFDEYATFYNKFDFSSRNDEIDAFDKHNDMAKEGFDKLKEIFEELVL